MFKAAIVFCLALILVDLAADRGAYTAHVFHVAGILWHGFTQAVTGSIFAR